MKIFTKDSHRWSLADMCWFLIIAPLVTCNINRQMLNMLAILHLEYKLAHILLRVFSGPDFRDTVPNSGHLYYLSRF